MLQEGTKRSSDAAHVKMWKKVLAACHFLLLNWNNAFSQRLCVKPLNPVAERLGMESSCLCSASCNDTCLSLCLSARLCTLDSPVGIITSLYIFTYWCLKHMQ